MIIKLNKIWNSSRQGRIQKAFFSFIRTFAQERTAAENGRTDFRSSEIEIALLRHELLVPSQHKTRFSDKEKNETF
jgi:hypothetical protein